MVFIFISENENGSTDVYVPVNFWKPSIQLVSSDGFPRGTDQSPLPTSPQTGMSIIKSLTEVAFVSSSVVATATVPEPPEISAPSASEPPSTSSSSFRAVVKLLLLQLWELCGYSQLPTATIPPALLLKDQQEWEKDISTTTQISVFFQPWIIIHLELFYLKRLNTPQRVVTDSFLILSYFKTNGRSQTYQIFIFI